MKTPLLKNPVVSRLAFASRSAAPAGAPSVSNFKPAPARGPDFQDRMVRLSNGRAGIRGGLRVETQIPSLPEEANGAEGGQSGAPGMTNREGGQECPRSNGAHEGGQECPRSRAVIDFIASNETLDRTGEIIAAAGWRLEQYRRNPVFQNAHQYGDVIFTLGKALITEVRRDAEDRSCLFQRIEFAVEANPMARVAYGLYRGKFLNAVSVGFIPLRWENGGPGSGYRRKYLEQELLEVSAVGIPANPDALQLGLKSGAITTSDLRELLAALRAAQGALRTAPRTSRPAPRPPRETILAVPPTHAGASGERSNEAQLLELARALRKVLRRT